MDKMLSPDVADLIKKKLATAASLINEVSGIIDRYTGPPDSPKPLPGTTNAPAPAGGPYGTVTVPGNPYNATVRIPAQQPAPAQPAAPAQLTSAQKGAKVLASARKKTGMPYQWGGTGNPSYDCSGLTQFAYRDALGIEIGRTTYDQIKNGREVRFEDAQDGDLIFSHFSAPNTPEHVSINISGPDKVFEAGDPIGEYTWGDRGPVVVKRYV